jgi:hypothetical protein
MTAVQTQPETIIPVRFDFTRRQLEALSALREAGVTEVMYGGAKGGGKSVFLVRWAFLHAMEIALEYGLKPGDHPRVVGWMGRKQGTDFRKSTLRAWERFIPANLYEIREQAQQIVIMGLVAIDFGGLDHLTDVQKFNSAEYAFFCLDQAEECDQDEIAALRGSLRLVLDSAKGIIPRKALFTANPAPCWLKDEFITNPAGSRRFIQALPSDNPFLGPEYVQTLKDAFGHRPEVLRAYLEGSWEFLAGFNQIIKTAWLEQAGRVEFHPGAPPVRLIVCDPARFGDDETVIYGLSDTQIAWEEIYGQRDLEYTKNRLFVRQRQMGGCLVVVDETGIGGGLVDGLVAMGVEVLALCMSSAAVEPERYGNLRAEIWDHAAQKFGSRQVSLLAPDPKLGKELTAPTYEYRRGRMYVEEKAEIKKRLGGSPDRADAYVMGLAGLAYLDTHDWLRTGESVQLRRPIPIAQPGPHPDSMTASRMRRAAEERRRREESE